MNNNCDKSRLLFYCDREIGSCVDLVKQSQLKCQLICRTTPCSFTQQCRSNSIVRTFPLFGTSLVQLPNQAGETTNELFTPHTPAAIPAYLGTSGR